MTDAEMVKHLREAGYKIQIPADLREAGPWSPSKSCLEPDSWARPWLGSTMSKAATVWRIYTSRTDCEYKWCSRLVGQNRYNSECGYAMTKEEAMSCADEALVTMLTKARAYRLRKVECCHPNENLKL